MNSLAPNLTKMFLATATSIWIRDAVREHILSPLGLDQSCNLPCGNEIGFLAQIVYSFNGKNL